MKKLTWIEENNNLLAPLGLCVDSHNGHHKIMPVNKNGKPIDFFAGHTVWRSSKRAEVDAWISGVLYVADQQKEGEK